MTERRADVPLESRLAALKPQTPEVPAELLRAVRQRGSRAPGWLVRLGIAAAAAVAVSVLAWLARPAEPPRAVARAPHEASLAALRGADPEQLDWPSTQRWRGDSLGDLFGG